MAHGACLVLQAAGTRRLTISLQRRRGSASSSPAARTYSWVCSRLVARPPRRQRARCHGSSECSVTAGVDGGRRSLAQVDGDGSHGPPTGRRRTGEAANNSRGAFFVRSGRVVAAPAVDSPHTRRGWKGSSLVLLRHGITTSQASARALVHHRPPPTRT
jgi:hypothetical protein